MTMDTELDLDAKLSLYNDTVCRDTGQYFCNRGPFSMPRTGNKVTALSCGKNVLRNIYEAIIHAESVIWIADWQMGFDVELVGRGHKSDHSGQLHKVIEKIISTKPVHGRILLFRSIKEDVPGTFDGTTSYSPTRGCGYLPIRFITASMTSTPRVDSPWLRLAGTGNRASIR